jgi:hypothetical protein
MAQRGKMEQTNKALISAKSSCFTVAITGSASTSVPPGAGAIVKTEHNSKKKNGCRGMKGFLIFQPLSPLIVIVFCTWRPIKEELSFGMVAYFVQLSDYWCPLSHFLSLSVSLLSHCKFSFVLHLLHPCYSLLSILSI